MIKELTKYIHKKNNSFALYFFHRYSATFTNVATLLAVNLGTERTKLIEKHA